MDSMKRGSRVKVLNPCSDYSDLIGTIVQEHLSTGLNNDRFSVAFDQTELRKAKRPEIVLKSKSNTVYFMGTELELVRVAS